MDSLCGNVSKQGLGQVVSYTFGLRVEQPLSLLGVKEPIWGVGVIFGIVKEEPIAIVFEVLDVH